MLWHIAYDDEALIDIAAANPAGTISPSVRKIVTTRERIPRAIRAMVGSFGSSAKSPYRSLIDGWPYRW